MLYTRCDYSGFRLHKGNRLSLHVRAHERTVGIVVFKEGYKRRRNRNKLLGAYVHIVYSVRRVLGNKLAVAATDTRVYKVAVLIERLVRLRDNVPVLLVRGKIVYFVRDHGTAVRILYDLAVRGHDKSVIVYLRESRQRGNKTYVLTFGGFYGAKPAVVRIVNVAHLERGSVAVKSAGTERGKLTLVGKLRRGVGLVHELRKLGRTEELPYYRGYGPHVYKTGRRYFHRVLRSHTLLYKLFKPCNTYAELVLKKLAHGTHAAVAEVVYVVYRAYAVLQVEVGRNGSDDIVDRNVLMVKLFNNGLYFLLLVRVKLFLTGI